MLIALIVAAVTVSGALLAPRLVRRVGAWRRNRPGQRL